MSDEKSPASDDAKNEHAGHPAHAAEPRKDQGSAVADNASPDGSDKLAADDAKNEHAGHPAHAAEPPKDQGSAVAESASPGGSDKPVAKPATAETGSSVEPAKPAPQPVAAAKPESTPAAEPAVSARQTKSKSELRAEAKAEKEAKAEAKAAAKATAKADAKAAAEAKATAKAEAKDRAKAQPQAKPEPKRQTEPEAKADPEAKEEKMAAALAQPAILSAAETSEASVPADPTASRRRRKLDDANKAARKDQETAPVRRRAGAVLLSLVAIIAAGGVVAAASVLAPQPSNTALPAAVTSLPAGDAQSVCAGTPQLLKGVDGTDPQFAAGAKQISSNIRTALVSDLGKRIPGATLRDLGSSDPAQLSERIPDAEAAQSLGADDEGLTGRVGKVNTTNGRDKTQVFSLQPLGELPSWGSAMRSFLAKDGDLAGLAAATCQAPASNWRFTGLLTNTGATSVLHLSNPTHTTAQVSIDLRGPEGLIDTSTLQNIVLAPGTSRALVLGGYAQNLDSVSAEITSLGGKITASVQQAALRGLTPSGVDLVAANASAANTQVIPGVWLGNKNDRNELSKDDKKLVPQLHVSATGAQGAGFKVKILGAEGEVKADLGSNLAVASDATSVIDLNGLEAGAYSVVVEADAPVTSSVRMVRGADPKDSSDNAWAASSMPLAGKQVAPISANGTGEFSIAAPSADASVEAVVVDKDGKLSKPTKLEVKTGQNLVFKPKEITEDAQAVIFSADANAYIGQLIFGSDRSLAWAAMPQANVGRDGIVVNVGG
ncbi:hypothetical protein CQ010_16155 [Arthrobacter sp. MYb211]|uniref:DUF5719 family protein n=1 Tax=unclassified Arthrobacter TaxID=235627 RepID=UPI000CFC6B3C|nr:MULTISPECIES: DUF5719 family protein [unclassified Arthrobacter]PRA09963.1 hypothetical protein CQ015_16140 [Arthrobacter sp. MYb221]PRC05044.1 hypothetical protein CQ010_16155 [Arthrobacter sp. MYb211]